MELTTLMDLSVAEKNSVTDKTSDLVHVGIILNPKFVNDELLALHGVLAHIIFQQFLDAEVVAQDDRFKAHVGTNEATELVGGDFAQTFESGDLGLLTAFLLGGDAFLVGVTVVGLLLVAHAEQRRLQDVDMAVAHQVGIELEEESKHQQADMHAIDIGIGGDDDVVVAQVLNVFVNIECGLQQVELLVLITYFLGHAQAVERLTAQTEHSLGLHVAALGDASRGGVALGDEDGAFEAFLVSRIEVDAAVAELAVVKTDLLGALAGGLLDAGNLLAFLFVGLNLRLQDADGLGVLMQVVVQVTLQDVKDVGLQEGAVVGAVRVVGRQVGGAEFGLGLSLKHRLLYADTQGAHQALTDVGRLVFLLVELAHHTGIAFAESRLEGAAFGGVLSVDEGIEVIARLPVDMGESSLKVAILNVDHGVEAFAFHVVLQQI